jgi:hypothetical protein
MSIDDRMVLYAPLTFGRAVGIINAVVALLRAGPGQAGWAVDK